MGSSISAALPDSADSGGGDDVLGYNSTIYPKDKQKTKIIQRPKFIKNRYDTTKYEFEQFDDIVNIEEFKNFGQYPTQAIHQVMLFLPPIDHLNISLCCKLFRVIGNTSLFWRQYCVTSFGLERVESEETLLSDPEEKQKGAINFKKFYFRNSRFQSEEYYKEKYLGERLGRIPIEGELSHHKLVLLGKSGAGKTCVIRRLLHDEYADQNPPTIGAAFLSHSIGLVKFEIWDTGGQERFTSLAPMYYRGASAVIVCIALDNKEAFQKLRETTLNDLNTSEKGMSKRVLLVGTKCDLGIRKVRHREIIELVEKNGYLGYVECSAKLKKNTFLPFGIVTEYVESLLGQQEE